MDTQNLIIGSQIIHPLHGEGIVTFIGTDYLGIAFNGSGEALIRREVLEKEEPIIPAVSESSRNALPWPSSTFVPEKEGTHHYLGSHWEPFVENHSEMLNRLPEIVPQALVQSGYGDFYKAARSLPEDWTKGFQLAWPLRTQGLALVVRIEQEANMIASLFPFFDSGIQHRLTLQQVNLWQGDLEAQITAGWGEGEITFFDTRFLINRGWYEAGKDYDFILIGMAYNAGPAEKHEWKVKRHPDEVAWTNLRLKKGEEPHESECTMTLDGAALFLPVTEWDSDDYSFHAPVKSIEEFKDWLGQDGWKVRATVMRFDDEDADLDIVITRRAWTGDKPPQAGQDIEGRLWLQGYLWMPR